MQGDIIAIVRGNKLVAEYEYDAWGNCTILRNTDNIANTNPLRYRGYYYDTGTNLYYLQSRYYDANIGRFINADDAELLGMSGRVVSNNLFAYCNNNPVNGMDPSGYYNILNFNCYAYAMGVFNKWLHPGTNKVDINKKFIPMPYSYSSDNIVNWVIKDFGKNVVRKLKNKGSKLNKGEYRVAIRTYEFFGPILRGRSRPTYDFHFMKQDPKTLKWWDKPGRTAIRCFGKVNPDKNSTWRIYNSNTKYIAVKKTFKSK